MKIGPYEVLGTLGRGGVGAVHRARSPDGEEVAVKVLHMKDAKRLARFQRERRLLGEFREYDGFVPLLDSGTSPEGPWLVMPIVPGGTLRDRLQGGRMSVEETVALGRTLSAAMARAHARGIVHRDLKPENILFTKGGRPLIADLGLGKHFDRKASGAELTVNVTAKGQAHGTFGYMPKEQMDDAQSVGPQADVFALGAMLYECLTGMPAFQGEVMSEVIKNVEAGRKFPLDRARPDTPSWLVQVIDRALAVFASDRFGDASALNDALVNERPPTRADSRPSRRPDTQLGDEAADPGSRRGLALLLALVLFFGFAAAAAVTFAWRAPPLPLRVTIVAPAEGFETREGTVRVAVAATSATSVVLVATPGAGGPLAVPLDAHGKAELDLPLPDRDTAVVVEAVATDKNGIQERAAVTIRRKKEKAEPVTERRRPEVAAPGRGETPSQDDMAAAASLEKAATRGNTKAMASLARVLAEGRGAPKDEASALAWARRAADAGDAEGMCCLGRFLAEGKGGFEPDEAQAVSWFRKAADAGDGLGLYLLGTMFEEGRGVARDDAEAVRIFRKAAAAGETRGMTALGHMLAWGRGAPRDEAAAATWYRKAAEAGSFHGMENLAVALTLGQGVEKDGAEAGRWLGRAAESARRAAESGDAEGMCGFAQLLESGYGGRKEDALGWARRSADAGFPPGMTLLSRLLTVGARGGTDAADGLRWARAAAAAGDTEGMVHLGFLLYYGLGATKDAAEAVRCFEKASDRGSAYGTYWFARLLVVGEGGLPADEGRAVRLMRESANGGCVFAMFSLGEVYEQGRGGVAVDRTEAIHWYREAAARGSVPARQKLQALGAEETPRKNEFAPEVPGH